jgi:Cu/Ag efflux protein CusF
MVQNAGTRHAFADQLGKLHWCEMRLPAGGAQAAGTQNLFDRPKQAITVGENDPVKLISFCLIDSPRLQRFHIQPDGRYRCLQLVRNGIDECVVLGVPVDLANQKCGVQNDAGNDQRRKKNTEKQEDARSPVEQDPPDIKKNCDQNQAGAERNEECDRFPAAGANSYHATSLTRVRIETEICTMRTFVMALTFCLLTTICVAQQGKKEYVVRGKIEAVDQDSKRLTVNHEKIEGLMDAMTMSYKVDKPEVLKKVKVGDQIKATLYADDLMLRNVEIVPPKK